MAWGQVGFPPSLLQTAVETPPDLQGFWMLRVHIHNIYIYYIYCIYNIVIYYWNAISTGDIGMNKDEQVTVGSGM